MKYNHLDLLKLYKYVRNDLFKGELPLVLNYLTVLLYKRDIYRFLYSIPLFTDLQQSSSNKEKFILKSIKKFNLLYTDQYMYETSTDYLIENYDAVKLGDALMYEHPKTKVIFPGPLVDKENYKIMTVNGELKDFRTLNIISHGKTLSHFDILTSEEIDDIVKCGIFNANIKWGKI